MTDVSHERWLEDLATRAGVDVDRVRRMCELGLIDDGAGDPAIARARMMDALERGGVDLADLAAMVEEGSYSMVWIDAVSPRVVPTTTTTLAEAAAGLQMPIELVRRSYDTVWQLPVPADDDPVREDDLELLGFMARIYGLLGRDADRTVAAGRYFGDNLRRLAESQTRYFREQFEDPLLASGMPHRDVMEATVALASELIPQGFRGVELLYGRHFEHYALEDIVTNIEIAMEFSGRYRRPATPDPALAFLDLTGFTTLTEEAGDVVAARLTERFAELVMRAADRHGGRVVKLLGDGAMFHVPDPAAAVRCMLELVDALPVAGLPAGHAGINAGPVVFRDGDYFGRAVNLAARLGDHATAGEVLVTGAVRERLDADDVVFEELPPVTLSGVQEPVPVWRARFS